MDRPTLRWPNWIGVVAQDFDAQRRFYRDVLGFREADSGKDWVQFDMGWPNLFELLRRSEEPQYDEVRFQVGFAVDDIHAARQELIVRGVEAAHGDRRGVRLRRVLVLLP